MIQDTRDEVIKKIQQRLTLIALSVICSMATIALIVARLLNASTLDYGIIVLMFAGGFLAAVTVFEQASKKNKNWFLELDDDI